MTRQPKSRRPTMPFAGSSHRRKAGSARLSFNLYKSDKSALHLALLEAKPPASRSFLILRRSLLSGQLSRSTVREGMAKVYSTSNSLQAGKPLLANVTMRIFSCSHMESWNSERSSYDVLSHSFLSSIESLICEIYLLSVVP